MDLRLDDCIIISSAGPESLEVIEVITSENTQNQPGIDPARIQLAKAGPAAEQPPLETNVLLFPTTGATEGGKAGKGVEELAGSLPADPPSSPPSPPLRPTPIENAPDVSFVAEGVFTPAPRGNPVIAALKAQGMYGTAFGNGRHTITCPWSHEHVGETVAATIYTEPTPGMPFGHFDCPHHGDNAKTVRDVLKHYDIDLQRARGKHRIRLEAGEQNLVLAAAEYALAKHAGYFQSNGSIATIRWDHSRGDVAVELVNEQMLTKAASMAADWEKYDGRSKAYVPIDPPVRIIQMLLKAQDYQFLLPLNGVARQPYFRASDGKLISRPGYDELSGIYAWFDEEAFVLPDPTPEAAQEALQRLLRLTSEMHFATDIDRVTAFSAMLTAQIHRRPAVAYRMP